MASTTAQRQWYLVRCRQRQDARALENLERQGFECYRPVRRLEKFRYGRKNTVEESFFPGYLFIRLHYEHDNWYTIRSTRGVIQIVCFHDYPTAVPDPVVEQIRARLADPKAKEPYLKPGERVCITEGPFAQLEAIFLMNDGGERVILLLNLLQQDQRVSFPIRNVRKLS